MKVHIILPQDIPDKIKKQILSEKTIDDRVDIIELKSGTDEIKKIVNSSNYEYFVVFNPNFQKWSKKYVRGAKKIVKDEDFILFTEREDFKEVSPKNSFICFKKGKEEKVEKNHNSVLGFLKDLTSKQPKNKTKKIITEKEDKANKKIYESKKQEKKNATGRKKSEPIHNPSIRTKGDKPKILFVCDVKG